MSPRLLRLPNLLALSSDDGAVDGLNLLPITQTSSLSANPPWLSGVEKPEPLRLENASGSGAVERVRVERHSLATSEIPGWNRSIAAASWRRREPSRESCKSGRGPSRLHGLSNFESSSITAANGDRSLADRVSNPGTD